MNQTSGRGTNARRNLLWMIFTLTVITFLDRLAIAAAMPGMTRDFGFTAAEKGYIFSAFSIAYAAFEIPSGWLGDRFGARLALTRIVLWWSAFTSLTGAALGFRSMVLIRFLFGAGEAGAFPNVARAISRWFGVAEQGRAMSVSFLGLAAGSALAAPLIFSLLEWQHWRWVFVELGVLGAVWALVWHRWFRDDPASHPGVDAAELARIRTGQRHADLAETHRVAWRAVLTSPNMILINLMYFAYGYGIFFYMTWLPTYLIEGRGFSVGSAKWLASLPWVISLPSYLFGGWLTDRLADRLARRPGGLRLARSGVGITGYLLSAGLLILVARVENQNLAATLLALALCAQTLTACAAWAVCLDVGRRNAGVVTGLMNTVGNVGGALAPVVVGIAVGRFQSWSLPFYIMAGLFTLGAIVWAFIDPEQSVLEDRQ